MRITKNELKQLMQDKLMKAGLSGEHAETVADVLAFADARGIHSHGAVRMEYYAERIAKGGLNATPDFQFEKTGPSTAIFDGDNGMGHVAAKRAMDHAIDMAKETGMAAVGIRRIGHSGAISYYSRQAAQQNLIGLSVCQSDPMVVPFGGAEPYYGTNPITFCAPGEDGQLLTFDMATTVQAWGKVLDARSKNQDIPDTWAVDANGEATTDPFNVKALLPVAGPKGYGLAMMVDILSGILMGLPFGKQVSSMYQDMTEYRNLGQLHLVINPAYFTSMNGFLKNINQTMQELNHIKPATGFDQVLYPGQDADLRAQEYEKDGIAFVDEIYDYLKSDTIHNNANDNKDPFAE